jgi:hypothetical protein
MEPQRQALHQPRPNTVQSLRRLIVPRTHQRLAHIARLEHRRSRPFHRPQQAHQATRGPTRISASLKMPTRLREATRGRAPISASLTMPTSPEHTREQAQTSARRVRKLTSRRLTRGLTRA